MNSVERLSDEARFELSLAAAGRERANRPRVLIVVSCLALVVALILAVWGLSSRGAVMRNLRATLAEQVRVEQMLQEWDRLERQQSETGAPPGGKVEGLFTRMEQLATRAGIKDKPALPRPSERKSGDIKVMEYHYQAIKDPSLKALLEWARLAEAEIPGMEVYGLILKPDPTNWTMDITFRRWERAQ